MMAEETKRPKLESKEDRISDLSDFLIQHILSFLPTTKQAIQTTVLSKRWHNQWTGVPVLIFNGRYSKNILKFHNCLKIKKFHFQYNCYDHRGKVNDSYIEEIVSFATRRHVEDLELKHLYGKCKVLPELFFHNISLVKLGMWKYDLMPKGKVNWASIKELNLNHCSLTNEAIEHILCGSPLLELINTSFCHGYDKFIVTSKYLKGLVLESQELGSLEISCPNLKQLSFCGIWMKNGTMFGQVIHNVLSVSSLLKSLKLVKCIVLGHLVISSESLEILVIEDIMCVSCLQVSCSKLEKLEFKGILYVGKVEFMNLPLSVRVYLDFPHQGDTMTTEIQDRLIKDSLQQLHHVNELKLGREFIKVLPGLEPRDQIVNKGAWSATEDKLLIDYVKIHGEGKWRNIPRKSDLQRCGKSCMLRWRNYLKPGIKRSNITNDEEDLIIRLHDLLGNRWSLIAGKLPGRTDHEIENYWNSIIGKKLQNKKIN